MIVQVFNIQRLSDGKLYQANGVWGSGNNYNFATENEALTFLESQSNDTYRINSLYLKS